MTSEAGPEREMRRGDVSGTVVVFNTVAVGITGLYEGTGSLWLAGVAGVVAAGLAGLHRVFIGSDKALRPAAAATPPRGSALEIGSAAAGGEVGVHRMDDVESRKTFEDFFRVEYPNVVYRVMRLGAALAEAEDIAAEAMLGTLTRWTDIVDAAAYAHTSARHAYFTKAKRKLREAPFDIEHLTDLSVLGELDLREQERRVFDVLGRLPRAQRTVMGLFYAGLSTEEIAHQLETAEATVRSNLRHARQRLRTLLADEGLL